MSRVEQYIMKRFYGGGGGVVSLVRSRNSTGSSEGSDGDWSWSRCSRQTRRQEPRLPLYRPVPCHARENCEACLLSRCPIPR